jgi:ADP-heptose:LPS heptosyltransferase
MLIPLKNKYQNSVLDVHTSTLYGSAFDNNPYITNLYQYEANSKRDALHLTTLIPDHIKKCNYDIIIAPHPMFNHGNWTSVKNPHLGTNLVCAWIRAIENLDVDYCLPLETVLKLRPQEIERAHALLQRIPKRDKNILMEIHGESGQSHWNQEWTIRIGKYLLQKNFNLLISRVSDGPDIDTLRGVAKGKVHFIGELSLRECAEVFNHCDAFLSISSGLSNACNTNWCKKDGLWFESTNSQVASSNIIRSENKNFWYDNNLDGYISLLHDKGL